MRPVDRLVFRPGEGTLAGSLYGKGPFTVADDVDRVELRRCDPDVVRVDDGVMTVDFDMAADVELRERGAERVALVTPPGGIDK